MPHPNKHTKSKSNTILLAAAMAVAIRGVLLSPIARSIDANKLYATTMGIPENKIRRYKMVSVAIDGPAGAGKSTLARRLAAEMGYIYVDTGAMFRTIGLYARRAGKDPKDNEAVNALLPEIELHFAFIDGEQHVYLKEEDVSTAIRTEQVGMAASAVGANPAVRAFLLELQRGMTKTQNVLMDGRDIGTVVLPDATVKIFLTAAPEARARRRWLEYQQKGMEVAFEDVLADVKQRDYQDTHRAAAPLKQAEDAVLLDTSDLNFEQSLAAMKKIIAEKVN